jgi:hypothetical protein
MADEVRAMSESGNGQRQPEGMTFSLTLIDADGNELEGQPGEVPSGCIGAVVQSPSGTYVGVPVTPTTVERNVGVFETFREAVEALQEWARR